MYLDEPVHYDNDPRMVRITFIGLAIAAVLLCILMVYVVKGISYAG